MGVVQPVRASRPGWRSKIHPRAVRYVVHATEIGIAVTGPLVVMGVPLLVCAGAGTPSGPPLGPLSMLSVGILFVPSLACLPIGAAALIGGSRARAAAGKIADPRQRQRMAAGWGLAWQIAWKSFLWSTFGSGLGYLVMYLFFLIPEL
jgi:hypothetical protein